MNRLIIIIKKDIILKLNAKSSYISNFKDFFIWRSEWVIPNNILINDYEIFLVLINQYHVLDRPSFKISRHNYYTANLKTMLQNYGFALFSGNFI